jgi:hypothetical protein
MDPPSLNEDALADADREEIVAALLQQLVMQQTNMALMFLGRIPHPETKETMLDLESAKLYIDQLEMLENRTAGNLTHGEESLLRKSLVTVRGHLVAALEASATDEDVPLADGD